MDSFDFWYAVNHTEILIRPRQSLETFGQTTLRYHLVTEFPDAVDRIRVREGRILAYRPILLTPGSLDSSPLEGFDGPAVGRYLEWLRANEQNLALLQYGFKIRNEPLQEHCVTDRLETVLARVQAEVVRKNDPLDAVLVGVDDPWEVCLLKLLVEVASRSAPHNARELRADPDGSRREIEAAFEAAARDRSQRGRLATLLAKHRVFPEYEDRFYDLVRNGGGSPPA
jgi:hypothetical protein